MQEYTILLLYPLGVDRNAIFRHLVKCILSGTGRIYVPAREYISILFSRFIVIVAALVIGSGRCLIGDFIRLMQRCFGSLLQNCPLTIEVCTVQEADLVAVTFKADVKCIEI